MVSADFGSVKLRVTEVMKHVLSAAPGSNSAALLHHFCFMVLPKWTKTQPSNSPFPVDVPGHVSVGIITFK